MDLFVGCEAHLYELLASQCKILRIELAASVIAKSESFVGEDSSRREQPQLENIWLTAVPAR